MLAVWRYFKVDDGDESKADCKSCSAKLSRGRRTPSTFNTKPSEKTTSSNSLLTAANSNKQLQQTLEEV